jgi:hypothetical protein
VKKTDGRKTRWANQAGAKRMSTALSNVGANGVNKAPGVRVHDQLVEALQHIRQAEMEVVAQEPLPVQMAYRWFQLSRAMWGIGH